MLFSLIWFMQRAGSSWLNGFEIGLNCIRFLAIFLVGRKETRSCTPCFGCCLSTGGPRGSLCVILFRFLHFDLAHIEIRSFMANQEGFPEGQG